VVACRASRATNLSCERGYGGAWGFVPPRLSTGHAREGKARTRLDGMEAFCGAAGDCGQRQSAVNQRTGRTIGPGLILRSSQNGTNESVAVTEVRWI